VIAAWALAALAGSIEGRVVDPDGEPATNATVIVYDRRLGFANASTGSTGTFRIDDLPDGPYRVRVVPYAAADLVEEWAHDTLTVCEGEVFGVASGGADPFVDIALEHGSVVRGVVVDPLGAPVANALVSARAVDAPQAYLRADVTDADGAFEVRGLATWSEGPTTYRLEVDAEGWPVQQLGGGYIAAEAVPVDVVRGTTHDVGTHALREGIHVAGTATGPSGEPVTGEARVYSGTQSVEVDFTDGVWAVSGLPPGQVLPWVRAAGYGTTWWPDADRPGERIEMLEEGATRDDVDIVLPAESRLRGRLLGTADTSSIAVLAYNDDQTVGVGAISDEAGEFGVGSLHPGAYTVFVFGAGAGYLDDFARTPSGERLVVEVTAPGDSPVVDVTLVRGARVSGTVRDRVTDEPVYGASVHAEGQATGSTRLISTDRRGEWALDGLPADAWALWVDYEPYCPTDPGWASIHHPDRVNPALVEVLHLVGGDDVTWDPRLPPDHDHDGMDDGWEGDHGLDPTRDDSLEDPDGDGFVNLEEYVLGTDPAGEIEEEEGCGGCGGGAATMFPLALFPWWRRRRVR